MCDSDRGMESSNELTGSGIDGWDNGCDADSDGWDRGNDTGSDGWDSGH